MEKTYILVMVAEVKQGNGEITVLNQGHYIEEAPCLITDRNGVMQFPLIKKVILSQLARFYTSSGKYTGARSTYAGDRLLIRSADPSSPDLVIDVDCGRGADVKASEIDQEYVKIRVLRVANRLY